MSNPLVEHYRNRLSEFGPSPQAVQYSDASSHQARFAVLAEIDPDLKSVLDVGCGLADLYFFLARRHPEIAYCGVDVVPEFVGVANDRLAGNQKAQAMVLDLAVDPLPPGFDFVMLSGVFNNRMDDNWGFMTTTLRKMWDAAEQGIAFNAMSTWVDYQDPGLWYVDPLDVLAFCRKELGGYPVLRHDYVTREGGYPFEFAVYLYKQKKNYGA